MVGLFRVLALAMALYTGSTQAQSGTSTLFADNFNRTTGLGSRWRIAHGAFRTSGTAALGTLPQSYAFWSGAPPADSTVSAQLGPVATNTYVGVVAHANPAALDRDHYAAYIGPDGAVGLSRRRNWVYTLLAAGPRVAAGPHALSLETSGTNPLVLVVRLDGNEVLRFSDPASSALSRGGAGIFDYGGRSSPVDDFSVAVTGTEPPVFNEASARAALAGAGQKLRQTAASLPLTESPKSTRPDGTWSTVANTDLIGWTQGFFPGSLWYLYRHTQDPGYQDTADGWTRSLEIQKTNRLTHDLGPKLFYSFGNAYQLTGNSYYRDVLLEGAESLASRYRPQVGMISCCDWNPRWRQPLVIDTMISLELLLWAADHGGRPELRQMAISHALVTAREMVRPDGSTFHVVDFDPTTGAVRFKETFQGYSDASTWSRGQAWAIYGFTVMYRYTKDPRMLDTARRVTDNYLNRLPSGGVPNWDFDAPQQFKDSSAAAITASALLELSTLEPDASRSSRYRAAALTMLATLSSPRYLAGNQTLGILLHGVGHLPANQEIDVSLVYGDYFFIEALVRFLSGVEVTPQLTLVSPNGGESLEGGQTRLSHWRWLGVIPDVRLELSPDGGNTWQLIANAIPNQGQFTWTIPRINTQTALMRISDPRAPSTQDVSDRVFTLSTTPTGIRFEDEFNARGPLGGAWWVPRGTFVQDGFSARAGGAQSYAFWIGASLSQPTVTTTLATPISNTYVGVIARAALAAPDRDHYAAYVSPAGRIQLARRNNYVYTLLADGPVFPAGAHSLSIQVSGGSTAAPLLSIALEGVEVLRFTDGSASALRTAGRTGIFDYNGAGQPFDRFQVVEP